LFDFFVESYGLEELVVDFLREEAEHRFAYFRFLVDEEALLFEKGVDEELAVEWAEPVVGAEEDGDVGACLFDEFGDMGIELTVEVDDLVHDFLLISPGFFQFIAFDGVEVVPAGVLDAIGFGVAGEAEIPIGVFIHEAERVLRAVGGALDDIIDETVGGGVGIPLPVDGDGIRAKVVLESVIQIGRMGESGFGARGQHSGDHRAFDIDRRVGDGDVHDDGCFVVFGEETPNWFSIDFAGVDNAPAHADRVFGFRRFEEIEDAVVAGLFTGNDRDPCGAGDGRCNAFQGSPSAFLHEYFHGGHDAFFDEGFDDGEGHAVQPDEEGASFFLLLRSVFVW